MERRKRHIVKLEGSIKKMSEELLKGNEIIKKLQNDIRNYHAKVSRNHLLLTLRVGREIFGNYHAKVSSTHLLLTLLFLTFLDHLLFRAGQYFSHPVFSILCHVFSQSVLHHVSLYVVPLDIYFSVGLCSFSQKPLVLAILHRCGCVLTSNSGQTTSVFCFPGKFQQVLRAPPS